MDVLQNLRSFRINDIVLFDTIVVLILAIIFSIIVYKFFSPNKITTKDLILYITGIIIIFFLTGIFTHYMFEIKTGLNYKLGLSNMPEI
jgi:membrane protein YdbS with pleckstrin-like domain